MTTLGSQPAVTTQPPPHSPASLHSSSDPADLGSDLARAKLNLLSAGRELTLRRVVHEHPWVFVGACASFGAILSSPGVTGKLVGQAIRIPVLFKAVTKVAGPILKMASPV